MQNGGGRRAQGPGSRRLCGLAQKLRPSAGLCTRSDAFSTHSLTRSLRFACCSRGRMRRGAAAQGLRLRRPQARRMPRAGCGAGRRHKACAGDRGLAGADSAVRRPHPLSGLLPAASAGHVGPVDLQDNVRTLGLRPACEDRQAHRTGSRRCYRAPARGKGTVSCRELLQVLRRHEPNAHRRRASGGIQHQRRTSNIMNVIRPRFCRESQVQKRRVDNAGHGGDADTALGVAELKN